MNASSDLYGGGRIRSIIGGNHEKQSADYVVMTTNQQNQTESSLLILPVSKANIFRRFEEEGPSSDVFVLQTSANNNNSNNGSGGLILHRNATELVIGSLFLLIIIFMTIGGNILVILSVFTHRPLKKVQNYFLVSLAGADLTVAILVMPFHVVKFFIGQWIFGLFLCQAWLTFDILCCTASILNLCAIAIDRYLAITRPIEYANKRNIKIVCLAISFVWIFSALISVPPLIGWNDWSKEDLANTCQLTSDRAFVIYSASGSFYLPLILMATVYVKIFIAARKRIISNRARSGHAKLKDTMRRNNHHDDTPAHAAENTLLNNGGCGGVRSSNVVGSLRSCDDYHKSGGNAFRKDSSGGVVASGNNNSGDSLPPPPPTTDSPDSALILTNNGHYTNSSVSTSLLPNGSLSKQPSAHTPITHSKKKCSNASSTFDDDRRRSSAGTSLARGASVRTKVGSIFKRKEKISVSKEKKAAKTLAIIMGVFVLCWFPFFLMYVILPFCPECGLDPKISEAITWLGYINSALNPVIYTIFNLDFRRAFQKFLCPKSVIRRQSCSF